MRNVLLQMSAVARSRLAALLVVCLVFGCAGTPDEEPEESGGATGPPMGRTQMLYEGSFELSAAPGRQDERSWSVREFSGLAVIKARIVDASDSPEHPPEASVTLGAGDERAGLFLEVASRPRPNYSLVIREPALLGAVALEQEIEIALHWDRQDNTWIRIGPQGEWHWIPLEFVPETLRISCVGSKVVVDRLAFYSMAK